MIWDDLLSYGGDTAFINSGVWVQGKATYHIQLYSVKQKHYTLNIKNSIRDACTPQPGEIVFNTMGYRSNETVQRLGYFQSIVSYIKVQIIFN